MYYVHHILKTIAASSEGSVKFIVVQDNAGTSTGGGKVFRDAINTICKMLPSKTSKELVDATTFVFTKVPLDQEEGEGYLLDVLDRVTPETIQEDERRVVEFLKTMRMQLSTIKHVEVPEVNTVGIAPEQVLTDVDYIVAPVGEAAGQLHEITASV